MGEPRDVEAAFSELRRLFNTMQARMRQGVAAHGMTPPQAMLLHVLRERGRATPSELAAALGVSQANVTLHLDRLEKGGHLVRTRSSDDKRVQIVRLTEKSYARANELYAAALDDISQLFAPLDDRELRELTRLLAKIQEREAP